MGGQRKDAGSDAPVLRPATEGDDEALFAAFARLVADGEGFPNAAPLTRADFDATWVAPTRVVVVAAVDGEVAGAYFLKPNFAGRAAHIANAGYFVDRAYRGRGIGRMLVEDSIERAPSAGFDAIQFNLVFESNPARGLYEELGWEVVGRLPRGVDDEPALIYWRDV